MREGFEKWAWREGYDLRKYVVDEYKSADTRAAFDCYESRQPEIDALKAEVERLRADADLSLEAKDWYAKRRSARESAQEAEPELVSCGLNMETCTIKYRGDEYYYSIDGTTNKSWSRMIDTRPDQSELVKAAEEAEGLLAELAFNGCFYTNEEYAVLDKLREAIKSTKK